MSIDESFLNADRGAYFSIQVKYGPTKAWRVRITLSLANICSVVTVARLNNSPAPYVPEKTDIFQLSEHRVITFLLGKEVEPG